MAERNAFGHLSYGVATRLKSFKAAEHDLDAVVAFVPALVVFEGLFARLSAGDAGSNLFLS